MARTAKFTDDLLLDAVVQYADIYKGKIKATELAEWARKNIAGLEEVKDYHFTRPVKNLKTGKLEKKQCTERIESYNVSRDTRKRENRNVLLSTINIDNFFKLSDREQRNEVVQAREIVAEYRQTNSYLRKKTNYLSKLQNETEDKINELEKLVKDIKAKQNAIDKKVSKLIKNNTEEELREKLAEIGIEEGSFDLTKYNESLRLEISEMFNIDKAIRQYQKNEVFEDDSDLQVEGNPNNDILNDLLDF